MQPATSALLKHEWFIFNAREKRQATVEPTRRKASASASRGRDGVVFVCKAVATPAWGGGEGCCESGGRGLVRGAAAPVVAKQRFMATSAAWSSSTIRSGPSGGTGVSQSDKAATRKSLGRPRRSSPALMSASSSESMGVWCMVLAEGSRCKLTNKFVGGESPEIFVRCFRLGWLFTGML